MHILQGMKPLKQGRSMRVVVIGVDSETYYGEPFTFQFYSEDIPLNKIVFLKNMKGKPTDIFIDCLKEIMKHAQRDTQFVLYGHNLNFDMVSFLYDRIDMLYDTPSFIFNHRGFNFDGVYGQPTFLRIQREDGHGGIFVIDTFSWFKKSLAKLAELFCPHLPKLSMPAKLGSHLYGPHDSKFVAYAMRDAVIAYHVGKRIDGFHSKYDIQQTFSAPHMASKIFRKRYLKETIPLPPRKIVFAALNSYHGGKNNLIVQPGWYPDIFSLDISSAYPYAMSLLPSFYNADLYRHISGIGHPNKPLPPFGVYKIHGQVKECKWPIIYDHKFKKLSGEIKGVWITGFELNEALRSKELKVDSLEGYFYDAARDKAASPFKEYVFDFYKLKESADNIIDREFYKLMMNSLYGKFIQARKSATLTSELTYDIDSEKVTVQTDMVAGGLFNPFIATCITGHTRSYIHNIEHSYEALHTATDGIFTKIGRIQTIRGYPRSQGNLGRLSIEAKGDGVILRNKLYIIYGDKNKKSFPSFIYKDKHVLKYALHGFSGDLKTLEEMIHTGRRHYSFTRVNKLRESVRRNLKVNNFEKRTGTLKLKEENN